jgi:hypothetical protein
MELLRLMLAHLRPRLQGRDEEWQALERKQQELMASFRETHGGDVPLLEEVLEMETYFRELIRGIDSSLLEEWEKMRNPDFVAEETGDKPARPSSYDLTRDVPAFRRLFQRQVGLSPAQ